MRRLVTVGLIICGLTAALWADPTADMQRLWRQAASGEIRFQNLVQPSKDSLSAMGEVAAQFLVSKLGTADAREKWALVDIYRGIGKAATPHLLPALTTNNKDQIRTTCRCLAEVKDTAALDGILSVSKHPDFTVRVEAVTAIGKTGSEKGSRLLEPFLADSVSLVRKAAVAGLGMIKSPGASVLLMRALNDDYYGVRLAAYDALAGLDSAVHRVVLTELPYTRGRTKALLLRLCGQLRLQEARPELERSLSEPDDILRGWAVWSLGRVLGERSRSLMSWLARSEPDLFVRSQAQSILTALDTSHGQ